MKSNGCCRRCLLILPTRRLCRFAHKIDDDVTHEKIITPILKKLQVDLGCQKSMIPEEYGGTGEKGTVVGAALRQEQLGRGDYGISMHSACTDWGWQPAFTAYIGPFSPKAKAWAKSGP